MGRLLFIIKMDNLKVWVILLKWAAHGRIIVYDINGQEMYRGIYTMVNPQENGCLQIQKTMKKQLYIIKIS